MQTYADMKADATFLPAQRPVDIEKPAHVMPGLVITAYGKDQTRAAPAPPPAGRTSKPPCTPED
jgi:hypothetical protein